MDIFFYFMSRKNKKRVELGSGLCNYWELLQQNTHFFLQMACK